MSRCFMRKYALKEPRVAHENMNACSDEYLHHGSPPRQAQTFKIGLIHLCLQSQLFTHDLHYPCELVAGCTKFSTAVFTQSSSKKKDKVTFLVRPWLGCSARRILSAYFGLGAVCFERSGSIMQQTTSIELSQSSAVRLERRVPSIEPLLLTRS